MAGQTANQRYRARLNVGALECRIAPATVVWDGGTTGNGTNWLDPINWVGDVAPTTGDDAQVGFTGSNPSISVGASTAVQSVSSVRSVMLTGGALTIGPFTSIFANLTLAGGTLNALTGATLNNSTVNGPIPLNIPTSRMLGIVNSAINAPLVNNGTLEFRGTSNLNGPINTNSSSTLRILGASPAGTAALIVSNGFVNQGAIELTSVATNFNELLIVNAGTLVNSPTGTITALLGAGGGRTFQLNNGAQFDNQGALIVSATNFDVVDGAGSAFHSSGTVTVRPGSTLTASGGILNTGIIAGGGTVTANVSGTGTMSPGESPGILTINGGVTLGALVLELNGTMAGIGYDQLAVNGSFTIGSMLQVTTGFAATPGDVFRIVDNDDTDPVIGAFTGFPENGILTVGNQSFRMSYVGGTGNDVTLTRVPRVDNTIVGDGAPQRSRVTGLTIVFDSIVTYAGAPVSGYTLEKIVNGIPAGTVGITVATTTVGSHSEATIAFASDTTFGSLNDGRYRLTVLANQIASGGQTLAVNSVTNFHRYYGDINGDAQVDNVDFFFFRRALGSSIGSPNYVAGFDFDGDDNVTNTDFFQFRIRLGTSLP